MSDLSGRPEAIKGVGEIVTALGIKNVSAGELEIIAEAVVGLVGLLAGSAEKRAAQAGLDAAAKITNAEEAEKAASERT